MKPQAKPHVSFISRKELIQVCNEKLICAARDLAEFTQYGFNATNVVTLATKCEMFEKLVHQSQTVVRNQAAELRQMETEIWETLHKLCEIGKRIWNNTPRYDNYVIASPFDSPGPALSRFRETA